MKAGMILVMEDLNMSEKQFLDLYNELIKISESCQNPNEGQEEKESRIYQMYALDTEQGKNFYMQIEDEILLSILRDTAEKINHSPAQKEIFWVWRTYIKKRFQKWPYALKAAGLSKSAGICGKTIEEIQEEQREYQMLLGKVREKAEELCRIPHPQEVPELCVQLRKFTKNWYEVIKDADLDSRFFNEKAVYKIENLEPEYQEDLRKILLHAEKLGRSPLKSETENDIKKRVVTRCGSWRNALYQIGLEPVVKIKPFSETRVISGQKGKRHEMRLRNCYYRILNPSEQMMDDFYELNNFKKSLNRIPSQKEVPAELRKRLQRNCGSLENAFYQLKFLRKH